MNTENTDYEHIDKGNAKNKDRNIDNENMAIILP